MSKKAKTLITALFFIIALIILLITLSSRGKKDAGSEPVEPVMDNKPASQSVTSGSSEADSLNGRQDGERFEEVVILEGMEETVRYEHVRNETIGFEMDYDYELFKRHSESDRECFVSCYDSPDNPENYLEVRYSPQDADTIAASVSEALSNDYDIIKDSYMLDRAGKCIHIDASNGKGNTGTPDLLQTVYIIPTADGCRIARAQYTFESAEGFGARFRYMMNTFSVISSQGEKRLTKEQAVSAIRHYCYIINPDLGKIVDAGEYPVYWDISSSDENEIVVVFRSYTGALNRYYIDPVSGDTYVTELVPGIIDEEQRTDENLNAWDYLY